MESNGLRNKRYGFLKFGEFLELMGGNILGNILSGVQLPGQRGDQRGREGCGVHSFNSSLSFPLSPLSSLSLSLSASSLLFFSHGDRERGGGTAHGGGVVAAGWCAARAAPAVGGGGWPGGGGGGRQRGGGWARWWRPMTRLLGGGDGAAAHGKGGTGGGWQRSRRAERRKGGKGLGRGGGKGEKASIPSAQTELRGFGDFAPGGEKWSGEVTEDLPSGYGAPFTAAVRLVR
uniref:Uncharacterized protein n=1 Tax=Oryza punctata TaxID=4537 RepID=A0A0E0KFU5_ORYPU